MGAGRAVSADLGKELPQIKDLGGHRNKWLLGSGANLGVGLCLQSIHPLEKEEPAAQSAYQAVLGASWSISKVVCMKHCWCHAEACDLKSAIQHKDQPAGRVSAAAGRQYWLSIPSFDTQQWQHSSQSQLADLSTPAAGAAMTAEGFASTSSMLKWAPRARETRCAAVAFVLCAQEAVIQWVGDSHALRQPHWTDDKQIGLTNRLQAGVLGSLV